MAKRSNPKKTPDARKQPEARAQPIARAQATGQSAVFAWAQTPRWMDWGLIAICALGMFWFSWGQWPDVLVDFGRELYVPWQITQGKVLSRDLAYFNGPLSPYVNAVWFTLLGSSLRTLALANFGIVCVLLALLYALLAQIGSRASALLGCLIFVFVFGFSQHSVIGNYNYIAPYSHEMTHGIVLALASIFFLSRLARNGGAINAAACGLFAGLVVLTKPEITLAIVPAVCGGVAIALLNRTESAAHRTQYAAIFTASLIAPVLVSIGLLSLAMPVADAMQATVGGLRWVLDPALRDQQFYRDSMGTLHLADNLTRLGLAATAYALLLGIPAMFGWRWKESRPAASWTAMGLFALLLVAGLFMGRDGRLPMFANAARPYPLFLLATLGVLGVVYWRAQDRAARLQLALPMTLVAFALLLLAKMIFNARLFQYGFGLAMPATLVPVVVCWDWLPQWIERHGGRAGLLRAALLAGIVVVGGTALEMTHAYFGVKQVQVGQGGDTLRTFDRGHAVNQAIAQIESRLAPDDTLMVVPEGVMLNYLTRRANPTPYFSLMPPEVLMFGEDQMLAALRANPPDYLLRGNDFSLASYGYEEFGKGFAQELDAWFGENYRRIGPAPQEGAWGLTLYERIPAPRP